MKIDNFRDNFAFLSNFHDSPIIYMGKEYKTVEHMFQASKALTEEAHEAIRLLPTPGAAKKAGRQTELRPDWESVKDTIMFHGVLCKFLQHKDLALKLIATGDIYLEEGNDWGDTYWGVVNGEGDNQLGETLMEV